VTQAHQRATTNGLGVDRAEAERFLSVIGRGATRFTFQTFDDSKTRRRRAQRNKVHKQRAEEEKDPFAIIFHGTLTGTSMNSCA
jgi:hypothetical protein